MFKSLRQAMAIFKKNLKRNINNKKKLLSQLIFPLVICAIYYLYKSLQDSQTLNPLSIIINFLLTIYIGLINSATIKQVITLFINQRQQGSRQYQYVMGLCKRVHTTSNMFYMMVYTSVFLFPFYVMLNLYGFKLVYIFNFAAFVISSNFLTIALTSFFTEHKVATQVIGVMFSLTAFLPFVYEPNNYNLKHYLAIMVPNSSFSLAIMTNDESQRFRISLASLVMWKFYLLVFYAVQFRQDLLEFLTKCGAKCRKTFGFNRNQGAESLMSDIQVEASSVLYSYQAQDDNMKGATPTIELTNVQKKFGKVKAVDGISLKIYKSEIFGLLGRNGAGKTTMVDMITKVTRPTHGYIKFNKPNDKPLTKGICYQHEILYEDLSVIDHLRFYAQIKLVQKPREQIQRIVGKVGIQDELQKKAKQLSGGNKRKLSFCIALLNSPDLLIFDQPTSGLDPLSRRNIWSILQNLRSSDTSIILTTHHLDQADHLSDRICVIKKGKIVQQGTPQQIKQKHGRGYYLTINYNIQSGIPFDIPLCHKIIKQMIKQSKLNDRGTDNIKYFINISNQYQNLIKCIQTLQRMDGISISLQANTLQQSFIAIDAVDAQQIQQQITTKTQSRQKQQQQNNIDNMIARQYMYNKVSNWSQIYGVILKNIYCYIGKFHWFYNMNIIVLAFVLVLNNLLISKLVTVMPDQQVKKQNNTSPLFIIQGYVLMSSAFMSVPVLEKEEKIILLLRTRGLKKINYWIGHFLFDFGYFCINFAIMYVWFSDALKNIKLWVMIVTACAMILYSYTASMIFNKVKTANSWFTIINTLLWLIMMPLMMPDALIQNNFYHYFRPLKYVFPFFDLSLYLMKQQEIMPGMMSGGEQTYTVHICFLFYLVVFIALQSKIVQKLIKRQEDQVVLDEIKLQNVYKKYQNTQALRNVSYSIGNQRVALLGHNGAGKSTTFGLLSAQLNVTEGKVFLERQLKKKHKDVMKSAGICYQEDTLWKFMTPDRVMRIFSHLVGVKNYQKQTDQLFDSLDIQRDLNNRKIENLSGGNKRKVCMAVCLMGSPRIKLLDECSTGLDPVSRLSMVNTLKLQSQGTTVFTTHSIPQAQQVCSRAIVMKKGQVSQDNKIFKLKQKYYHCYWVSLVIDSDRNLKQVAQQIFKNLYKNKQLVINDKKKRVQIQKTSIKLSQLMQMLYHYKGKLINDFNIDQPKLEDVYLHLTADEGIQMHEGEIQMQQMN